MNETWIPVVGYELQYEASSEGRVRSLARVVIRKNGSPMTVRGRLLKPGITSVGYPLVVLCVCGQPKSYMVHRLVAEAFLGPAPEGHEVDHINGDRQDNRALNLRWATRSQNNANARSIRGASQFKGVVRGPSGKWVAQIGMLGRRHKYLGVFESEEDAARAYDEAAQRYFGAFAKLNFSTEKVS